MSKDNQRKKGMGSVLLESINQCLPNCDRALELAGLGAERPLSWSEKIKLKYHGQLCPFCSCKELRLQSALQTMHEKKR